MARQLARLIARSMARGVWNVSKFRHTPHDKLSTRNSRSVCLQYGRIRQALTNSATPRRWTVIGSGLLCGILAVIVLFTNPRAFASPLAVVVVAAVGLAAVLLQLRMRNRENSPTVHPPVWLNILGIVLALIALFADLLHVGSELTELAALGAVGSFAISSAVILHSFRKQRAVSK